MTNIAKFFPKNVSYQTNDKKLQIKTKVNSLHEVAVLLHHKCDLDEYKIKDITTALENLFRKHDFNKQILDIDTQHEERGGRLTFNSNFNNTAIVNIYSHMELHYDPIDIDDML